MPSPPPASRLLTAARAALFAVSLAAASVAHGSGEASLRVAFGERTVVFAGAVDSEKTVETLVAVARAARPDLVVERAALVVDPAAETPAILDLRSLLVELALSTHEGRLELWPDRVVVGGLTDSLVTQSALRVRAESLLGGRAYHNRVCIVNTEMLPRYEVSLADGTRAPNSARDQVPPKKETPFSLPGLPLEKLLATRRMLGEIDRLAGRAPEEERLAPVRPTEAGAPTRPVGTGPMPAGAPLAAVPIDTWTALRPVLFSRNSFLLQQDQGGSLDAIAKELLSPARLGAPIRVEAVKPTGGSEAFNDYLCERRVAEVLRLLAERGVASELAATGTVVSPSPIDLGEVRVLVDRLPEPEPDTGSKKGLDDCGAMPAESEATEHPAP